jgi:uncharacterized membrane protein
MNLHPIIVHFPIAFLVIWSFCEILPVSVWFKSVNWKPVKNFLVLIGFLGGWVSQVTGEVAEHLVGKNDIVEMHAFFAQASMIIFGIFAVEAVVIFLKSKYINIYSKFDFIAKIIDQILKLLQNRIFRSLLALLGLIAIFTTGLLGGVLVYGTTADPLAPYVLKILGL